VNRLELDVEQRRLDDMRQPVLPMHEGFQGGQGLHHGFRGRRHELGVTGARSPDPVLRAPELPRLGGRAASFRQEHAVDLAQEAQRQRKTVHSDPADTVLEGRNVAGDFRHIVERNHR